MNLITVLERAFRDRDSVTSGELQQILGLTRQTVWSHVRRLVETGVLVAEGAGRGTRYRRGPGLVRTDAPFVDARFFWDELARRLPDFSHVPLQFAARSLSRASDAQVLVQSLSIQALVVFDFAGVPWVGEPFARHLLCVAPNACGFRAVAINSGDDVRRTIARVIEFEPARWRWNG